LIGARFRCFARCGGKLAALFLFAAAPVLYGQDAAPAPGSQAESESAQAQAQVNMALQQRLLGLVPNFFVVYTPHPVPLSSKEKFHLALRSTFDPMAVVGAGVGAAYGQATNDPEGFGQGAAGYGARLGATYGANLFGDIVGNAVVPSILKQDPRYFYKGTGTIRSRFFYAAANSFICMGDNGHWQLNVSQTMGSLATAGITELEYPPRDRFGIGRVFRDFIESKAAAGLENVFQEFFSRRLTPKLDEQKQTNP
jgi:hypothetical protein